MASSLQSQSSSRRCLPLFLTFLLLTILAFFTHTPTPTTATHLAYGTISFQFTPVGSTFPYRYNVMYEGAFRRNFESFQPLNPSVGQTFTGIGSLALQSLSAVGPCCNLPSGDACWKWTNLTKYTGISKGCSTFSVSQNIALLVKVTYPDNWLSGQSAMIFDAYNYAVKYRFYYNNCCRLTTLAYSGGSNSATFVAIVGTGGHLYSARSTSFPRQYIYAGEPMDWVLPSVHPLGWSMTYSLSPASESALNAGQETPPATYAKDGVTRLVIDSQSGRCTWTPRAYKTTSEAALLFPIQFRITSKNPDTNEETWIVLDSIFQLLRQCLITQTNCPHAPYFEPVIPPTMLFYKGVARSYNVIARDDDNDAVEQFTTPLPVGASFTYVSSTTKYNAAVGNRPYSLTTYVLQWAPSLVSVPAVVCFTARKKTTGLSSVGSNCANLIFGDGSILFVSGLLRDFHSSAYWPTFITDFNRTDGDIGLNYVQSTLGSNSLPVWAPGNGATTTNEANFNWWFKTDPDAKINMPEVYDIVLNNATSAAGHGNVYLWQPTTEWWPIDNDLFGNENDTHNNFFTLELHTYITYRGGETLRFRSNDDLFVFIDKQLPPSWSMSGIISTQQHQYALDMDSIKDPIADKDKTYQLDLFYAHRSKKNQPYLSIELLSATLCNSLDSGLTLLNLANFSQGSKVIFPVGGQVGFSGTDLQLMIKNPSSSSAAWFTDGTGGLGVPFKIAHGFSATFNFRWDGLTEGFAFVMNFDNPAAIGGGSGGLGYGGLAGLKNSIAVEFDGVRNADLGDPTWQHVGIHSRFDQPNSASESSRITGSQYSVSSIKYAFHNTTWHNVKVEYVPAVDDGSGGPQYGWIRVYTGLAGGVQQAVPVTSAQVDGVVLEKMWHGAAYVGFTAGTSDVNSANVYIQNFKLVVVPPSSLKSVAVVLPPTLTAGDNGLMIIQLKDVCGNLIKNGGDCSSLNGQIKRLGVVVTTLTCGNGISDNGDGTYSFSYVLTKTSEGILYQIGITYTNPGEAPLPIAGSPWPFAVVPAQTSPITSSFSGPTYTSVNPNGYPLAGVSNGTIVITARDIYNNLQTENTDPFTLSFSPDLLIGGGFVDDVVKQEGSSSTYSVSFSSNIASTFSMYVRLLGSNLAGSPATVIFAAGAAYAPTSFANGGGLTGATVGTTQTFQLTLRDIAYNTILQQNNADSSCLQVSDGCKLVPVTTTPAGFGASDAVQTGVPTPVSVPVTCAWGQGQSFLTCSYKTNIAYTYTLTMNVNGQAMPSLASAKITVQAGAISGAKCVAQIPTTAAAGTLQSALLQARDQYSNNVFAPSSTPFTVAFNPTLTFDTPIYSSYGMYTLQFIPTKSGTNSYSISVKLGSDTFVGSPYLLSVTAGSPDKLSKVTNTIATTITAATVATSTFTIESHDQYDNLRVQGGPGSDYLVSLTNLATSQVLDNVATIPAATNQNYNVKWTTTIAGTYSLQAKVRSQTDVIVGGQVQVVVNPDVTSTPHCLPAGDGIVGGPQASNVSISVQAKDQFDNVQLLNVSDTFRVIITSGTNNSTTTMTPPDINSGFYKLTYIVPYGLNGGNKYKVNVQRRESTNTWVDLPGSPFTCTQQPAANSFWVTTNVATGTVGVQNQFTVTEIKDDGLKTPLSTASYLTVEIVSLDGGATPTITIPGVTVTSPDNTVWTVKYTPAFLFPNGNSSFSVVVRRGNFPAIKGSFDPTIIGSPYPLVLTAGAVSGPNSAVAGLPVTKVAGTSGTFSVSLKDAYGNPINYALVTGANGLVATVQCMTPVAQLPGPVANVTINPVSSFSNGITTYTFSYSLNIAASYNVYIKYQGQTIGSSAILTQITVQPSVPVAATSTVIPSVGVAMPAAGLVTSAGVQSKFTVVVRDQYNNLIQPSLLSGGKIDSYLNFALADGSSTSPPVFGVPTYTGGGGAFDVSLLSYKSNPLAADTYSLTVKVSNVAITPSTKVHVNSAGIDASKSSYTGLAASYVAGTEVKFTFNAVDLYGNPWDGRITALISGSDSSATVVKSPSIVGQYGLTFASTNLQKAKQYTFEISADGYVLTLNTVPTTNVTPGQIDPTKTEVPPYLDNVKAGDFTTFTLGLRDLYSNIISTIDAATLASLSVRFMVNTGEMSCNGEGGTDDVAIDASNRFLSTQFTNVGGVTSLTYQSTIVGSYVATVMINGVELDCSKLIHLIFRVTPGPGVAAMSRVNGLQNIIAGQSLVLSIILRDAYGNQLAVGGSNVQVGAGYADSTPWSNAITNDPAQWLHNTSSIVDLGAGKYSVSLAPTVAQTLEAVITLDQYLIKTYADDSANVTVTPLVTISPNVPATWSVDAPTTIFAATPFTLTFQVQDVYGNPITVLNGLYNYGYTISGQSLNYSDYTFGGQLTFLPNGQYQWTATSALDGPVKFYISLDQYPNDDCIAADPSLPYKCSDFTCKSSSNACPGAAAGKGTTSTSVLPATCAAVNVATPYRCPQADNSTCTASYATCPSLAPVGVLCSDPSKSVKCAVDNSCVPTTFDCPCPGSQKKCASGVCVDDAATQCHAIPSCPGTQTACTLSDGRPTGECRTNTTDCPSPSVCTPGYLACPDGNSCRRTLAECSNLYTPATCPLGTARCSNGRCTSAIEDCPTPVTCPSGKVHCLSDDSCQDSAAHCPDQYLCYTPTPFQCADGSCRASAEGCPSQTTCPIGWVSCENGQCAQSLSKCIAQVECDLSKVRCPSGSCVANLLLCPTEPTCPALSPVLCADNSCQPSVAYCVTPRVCPSTSVVCPDGSCATNLAQCPSKTTCPASTPVLCADGVTCVSALSTCVAPPTCPIDIPMRCPDGSCRGSLLDCPSRSQCPSGRPVRCADGSCVYSSQQCAAIESCSATEPFRCPGGECVASTSLCPTHVTCPYGSYRCADGSCRTSCTGVLPINCATNQFACPLASVGTLCVNTLDQCPSSFICPSTAPVRCIDSSCAASSSLCPPLPPIDPETSKVPCPDGSWTTDLTTCNTPVSCPAITPYKCWDETCRKLPSDCTVPAPCTSAATPYRCPNGQCANSPYSSECRVTLQAVTCDANPPLSAPVKCASTYTCVTDVEKCPDAKASPDPLDPTTWPAQCPPQWAQCRDGSCRQSVKSCDPLTCPANLPYLCPTGVCATKYEACPDVQYGCFPPLVGCASTGACVNPNDESACPEPPSSCAQPCKDGFCVSEENAADYNAICAIHNCALRCADGTCGLVTSSTSNITASTPGNMCTASGTQDSINTPLHNVCPPLRPYKCPNGLCAYSSLGCNVVVNFGNCPAETPVQCANAACVKDIAQCAPIYPCAADEMRCGDGSCRVRQAVDFNSTTCSAWGITNTCPTLAVTVVEGGQETTEQVPRYRCTNGMCGLTNEASSCIDETSGCPNGLPTKCPNGACIAAKRYDNSSYPIIVDRCLEFQPSQADGCPTPKSKCSYGGQCVLNTATDCPLPNGCLPAAPFRCTSSGKDSGECTADTSTCTAATAGCFRCADGSCAANNNAQNCKVLNGCPATTPYRCANGDCAEFGSSALLHGATLSQVCQPTVTCASSTYLCYDGSCAAAASLCPSALACMSPNILCTDRTCVTSADKCITGVASGSNGNGTSGNSTGPITSPTGAIALAGCPKSVPLLCDNGQCVSSVSSCPTFGSPGSGTGTGQGGTILQLNGQEQQAQQLNSGSGGVTVPAGNTGTAQQPATGGYCSGSTPVECVDGTCTATFDQCRIRSEALRGGTCPTKQVMCPTGECVPDPLNNQAGIKSCHVIPACGNGKFRCASGACVTSFESCVAPTAECGIIQFDGYLGVQSQRCQDGVCRYVCPDYDGCPHTVSPFQCSNRECAVNSQYCAEAANGAGFIFSQVRPFLMPPLVPTNTATRRLMAATGVLQYFETVSFDTTTTDNSTDSGTTTPTASGTSGYCYANCASQLKASDYTTMVDINSNQKLVVTTDANHVEFASLTVNAGSLLVNSSTSSATRVTVSISPVADSIVRAAENRVPSSRTDVTESGFLTYVETVLSPMFELEVDPLVQVPFASGLIFTATMDMTLAPTPSDAYYRDICLAKLFQLSDIGYSSWRCLYSCTEIDSTTNKAAVDINGKPIAIRCSIHDSSTSSIAASSASGSITEPGIYAFVLTPIADPVPPSKLSWLQENAIWIFLIIAAAIVFIFFVFYAAQRLWRYRQKYHAEREEVQKQLEEVTDMEQFGGQAGKKDEEVVMMSNPMVVQMKDMQARLDENALKLREEEAAQKQENTAKRHDHIIELQEDRDKLARELEELQIEVAKMNMDATKERATAVHVEPSPVASTTGIVVENVDSDADFMAQGGLAASEGRSHRATTFAAVRPNKARRVKMSEDMTDEVAAASHDDVEVDAANNNDEPAVASPANVASPSHEEQKETDEAEL